MISIWESQPSLVLTHIINKEDLNALEGTVNTGDHWKTIMIDTVEDLLVFVFCALLMTAAYEIGHMHWFIADADEQDPHSLACFMHILHEQCMLLLKGSQLTHKKDVKLMHSLPP